MLRLRQICLAAPALEPAVEAVRAVFGLEVCHRDDAVGAYGLENALFVLGHQFLEIVAPLRPGTAVGRFLARGDARGAYMAIFDCDDPERRRAHVESLGVRVAHVMDRPGEFFGIQLHPRDARATMLEFDRSAGNERLDGGYWPAGPHWQRAQRMDRARGISRIDVASPDPRGLGAHWARMVDRPLAQDAGGRARLAFDLGAACFVPTAPGAPERVEAMHVEVDDPDGVCARASAAGCPAEDGREGAGEGRGFVLCGVRVVPHGRGNVPGGRQEER